MIGALFVLLVAWLFLAQWIRVTVFVVAIMIWLNVLTIVGPAFTLWPQSTQQNTLATTGGTVAPTVANTAATPVVGDIPAQTAPPTSENLNAWLASFYAAEEKRQTPFPTRCRQMHSLLICW
jgi:hypothetical protein